MSPESSQPRQWPAVLQPVVDFVERLDQNPPIDALKKSITVVLAAGVIAVGADRFNTDASAEAETVIAACDVNECGAGIVQPDQVNVTTTEQPTTTTQQPVPETPAARPQYEPLRWRLEGKLQQVPTIPELGVLFPTEYADWQQQLDYINFLDQQAVVRPGDYHDFRFNDEFMGAFAGNSEYGTRITPQVIIPHWTVHRYPPGLEGGQLFVTGLLNSSQGPLSSNYFIDHDGTAVYRYYDEDTHMTAGARGMNDFGVNIELEAGLALPTDQSPTVIYDVQPEALEKMVITVVQLARRYNLAISEYTVVGHYAGDMIFVNRTFNAENGTVESLRKFDMPQELVAVIIRKAQALDRQLG